MATSYPNKRLTRIINLTFLTTLLTMTSGVAQGQQIEEVIVTAQKRNQNIQDIPFGISTLDAEAFAEAFAGGADALALASRLPSLYVESSNGKLAPRFYIRGIGNVDFDLNASQPISLVYDEMVLENPTAKSFPLFDIERVEVLRGPQGTLFGRNTTAGIVKFDSFKPSDEDETKFRGSFGNYGFRSLEGVVNRPWERFDARVRLSFLYNRQGNWIDNVAPGYEAKEFLGGFEDFAVRFQYAEDITPKLAFLANYHYRSLTNGTPTIFYGNAIQQGSNQLVDGFRRDQVHLDAYQHIEQDAWQIGSSIKFDYAGESVRIISITGWHGIRDSLSRGDIDGGYGSVFAGVLPSGPGPGIPFDAQTADGIPHHMQLTQEVRLEGDRSGRKWSAGIYLFREDLDIDTFNYSTLSYPFPVNGLVFQSQETRAWAVFGTYDLLKRDRFTISGGSRLTSDEKNFSAIRATSPLSFLGIGQIGPLEVSPSERVPTWDLNALYEHSEQINWFARLAKGYRAPSIQGRLLFQDEISVGDAEHGLSFEFGLKSLLLDKRMRFDATIYNFKINDFQLTKIGGAGNINTLVNTDALDGNGLELNLEYFANASLLLNVGFSYNRTSINDPGLSVNGCGSAGLLYGCTVTDPLLPNGEYSIHGNTLYNAPELMFQTSLRYERSLANGTFMFVTDWVWHDKIRYTLYESIEYSDDGRLEGGIRASYTTQNEKYRVSAYVRNLTDDVSLIGSIDFNNLTAMLNSHRKFGVEWEVTL